MGQRPRIVIAGGTGFLGRRLAAVLAGGGSDIVILSRSPARTPIGPITFAQWAPDSAASAIEHLESARAVVNVCGESIGGPRWTPERKRLLEESRTRPTRALVDAVNACRAPPAVFLQASGVGYYGTGERACTEESLAGDDFLARLAGAWEAPLADLRDDVRPVIARLGVVLGRGGGALAQMLLPFRMFVGGPLASGRQWLSWIHLHDAIAAMVHLLEADDARGIYNLTAPNPVRNEAFAAAAAKALHRPKWMFTPRFVLNALLGEQATLVCDGQHVMPERLIQRGFRFDHPTIEAALGALVD